MRSIKFTPEQLESLKKWSNAIQQLTPEIKEEEQPLIKYCTLTGADESTPVEKLIQLSKKYPFVEWGVLYSESKMGTGRYPSLKYIDNLAMEFAVSTIRPANISLHICGGAVKKFINNVDPVLNDLVRMFRRVQLNFRSDNFKVEDIKNTFTRYPSITFITQHNKANSKLLNQIKDVKNHAILFDSSGGRGIEATEWPLPFDHLLCGYAGGLGPDNIEIEIEKIKQQTKDKQFYIDMENKLRNDQDQFDLVKCEKVLKLIEVLHIANIIKK